MRITPDEWESAYNPFQAYPCVAPCGCRMIQEPIEHPVKAWRLVIQVPASCTLDSAKIGRVTDSVRYEAAQP